MPPTFQDTFVRCQLGLRLWNRHLFCAPCRSLHVACCSSAMWTPDWRIRPCCAPEVVLCPLERGRIHVLTDSYSLTNQGFINAGFPYMTFERRPHPSAQTHSEHSRRRREPSLKALGRRQNGKRAISNKQAPPEQERSPKWPTQMLLCNM